jgi:hypothetical protein
MREFCLFCKADVYYAASAKEEIIFTGIAMRTSSLA